MSTKPLNLSDIIVHLQAIKRKLTQRGRASGTGSLVSYLGDLSAAHHSQLSKIINLHLGESRWLADMSTSGQHEVLDALIAELRG